MISGEHHRCDSQQTQRGRRDAVAGEDSATSRFFVGFVGFVGFFGRLVGFGRLLAFGRLIGWGRLGNAFVATFEVAFAAGFSVSSWSGMARSLHPKRDGRMAG